ncbi:unnamed protein product [Echinostoma caproni]|uniref:dolichyl-diphosphooligosaccharide--protein glycotransferase n=1 Tax=Echinostoma caproni TaxID=27848 RepID=A0A183B6L3_9TREM|nr:unnamed protein product [Echinostoma caproni]
MLHRVPFGSKQISVTGWCGLLTFCTLLLAWVVGFSIRLFSVIRFESVIHEFDPWFNYRATKQMVENNFQSFYNWFDSTAWYPLGRIVGGTVYPGLMVTSAPGYISRSSAGSYDNEGIAIFALMFTYYLWVKAVKSGSVFWAAACALAYFYMVSAWGGYVFIINLIPLHVFVLLLMNRYSAKIYVAYTVFFILGLLMSMQVPFVGFQPLKTSEHMASLGVFALIQVSALPIRFYETSI